MRVTFVSACVFTLSLCVAIHAHPDNPDDVVVEIRGSEKDAKAVAAKYGFRNLRKVLRSRNLYHFSASPGLRVRRSQEQDAALRQLEADPLVNSVFRERTVHLEKRDDWEKIYELEKHLRSKSQHHQAKSSDRSLNAKQAEKRTEIPQDKRDLLVVNDRNFKDQWYLVNRGQVGGEPSTDINVLPAWKAGICGLGIKVLIIDDGLDHTHEDLKDNYDESISDDFQSKTDSDPQPKESPNRDNSHGTKCAGVIAAVANNSICGAGVSFCATIGGIRLLDGRITDVMEAETLVHKNQEVHIVSASWGPTDDGRTMGGQDRLVGEALKEGATLGRNGLGTIFIFAGGNGRAAGDTTNADGLISSKYTIGIGSVNSDGESVYYSEWGSSLSAVTPVGGMNRVRRSARDTDQPYSMSELSERAYEAGDLYVTTTSTHQSCVSTFVGTSAAAPLAAGCMALLLQANELLSARDVQHLIAETARIPNSQESGWIQNGAGHHVHHGFGFGLLDCSGMVHRADNWTSVPPVHECSIPQRSVEREVPANEHVTFDIEFDGCANDTSNKIIYTEHVEIHLNASVTERGALKLVLESPMGTRSILLQNRPKDDKTKPVNFVFTTLLNWGENPVGTWKFEVYNNPQSKPYGLVTVHNFSMTVNGPDGYTGQPGGSENELITFEEKPLTEEEILNTLSDSDINALVSAYGPMAVTKAIRHLSTDMRSNAESSSSSPSARSREMSLHEVQQVMTQEVKAARSLELRSRGPIPDLAQRRNEQRKAVQAWKRTLEAEESQQVQLQRKAELMKQGQQVELTKRLQEQLREANRKLDVRLSGGSEHAIERKRSESGVWEKLRSLGSVLKRGLFN